MTRKLHIGGSIRVDGWEVLDVNPGAHVDHVQNAGRLENFAEETFEEIYASHILEHFSYRSLPAVLTDWCRVLVPGGKISVSVPDLDTLAYLFLNPHALLDEQFHIMRMMFGGHVDAADVHMAGLNEAFLRHFLALGGFVDVERVAKMEVFEDTSNLEHRGQLISLNMTARKPEAPDG